MPGEVDERSIVDDATAGLADDRGLHAVVKDLAGNAPDRVEGGTIGIFVCEAVFRHASTKRSLNITANCVFASNHSRGGRFQSAAA